VNRRGFLAALVSAPFAAPVAMAAIPAAATASLAPQAGLVSGVAMREMYRLAPMGLAAWLPVKPLAGEPLFGVDRTHRLRPVAYDAEAEAIAAAMEAAERDEMAQCARRCARDIYG